MALLLEQKTELLVDGYIREHEKILKLSNIIPQAINFIIFQFQLLFEKWNTEFSNSNVNIIDDGSIAESKFNGWVTFYGSHIVKYREECIWNLEITDGDWEEGQLRISGVFKQIIK